jgi:hypothetical protein
MRYNTGLIKVIFLGSLAFALAACGSNKDANKSNFSKAIQAYLDTQPGLCAAPPAKEIPFVISSQDFSYKNSIQKADALVDAGLLSKRDTEAKALFGDKMLPATEYQITEAGQKARVAHAANSLAKQDAFCAGKYSMVEVDNFTEPSNMMGMTISEVKFRYKVENPAGWAKTESLRTAFKNFENETQGDIQGKAALVLTNNGWVHERLFKK